MGKTSAKQNFDGNMPKNWVLMGTSSGGDFLLWNCLIYKTGYIYVYTGFECENNLWVVCFKMRFIYNLGALCGTDPINWRSWILKIHRVGDACPKLGSWWSDMVVHCVIPIVGILSGKISMSQWLPKNVSKCASGYDILIFLSLG